MAPFYVMILVRVATLLLLLTPPVLAQGAAPPLAPRPSPLSYFFRSFAIPGLGQAQLDRKLPGALFVAVEGISLGMGLKASQELRYLERTGSGRAKDKRNEKQDWFFLMAVNHLFSGMEAYVAASLYDFPGDLHAGVSSDGRPTLGLTLPLKKRP